MSLSAWEQNALDSIKDGLAGSDPALVARLTIFTRLASGEEMPAREKIQVGSRLSRPKAGQPARVHQRLGLHQTVPLLLWLVTTVALIAVALVYNRGGARHLHGILGNVLHRCDSAAVRPRAFPDRPWPGASRGMRGYLPGKARRSRHDHLDAVRSRHHARAVTTAMTATRAMSMYSR